MVGQDRTLVPSLGKCQGTTLTPQPDSTQILGYEKSLIIALHFLKYHTFVNLGNLE
jgi:hypothetical protein